MEHFFRLGYTDSMGDDTVGAFIRRQREAAKLTQRELGEAIDITDRRISEWETGRALPGRAAIKALSRFFRISADEYLQRLSRDPELDAIIAEEIAHKQGHAPERVHAQHIIEDLIDHPELFSQWLDFGEFLLRKR